MTFEEAIALQPAWLDYWLKLLLFGALALPLVLLIWRQSRIAGIAVVATTVAGGFATEYLYNQLGYVKLLGLPHIIVWTPVVIYLFSRIRAPDMPNIPRYVMIAIFAILVILVISLAFDYTDVIRYLAGEREPFPGTLQT